MHGMTWSIYPLNYQHLVWAKPYQTAISVLCVYILSGCEIPPARTFCALKYRGRYMYAKTVQKAAILEVFISQVSVVCYRYLSHKCDILKLQHLNYLSIDIINAHHLINYDAQGF